jgi:hypothetical protein
MPLPARIPIAYNPDHRTDMIGSYADGQFYATVHGAHRDDDQEDDRGRERVRWYAYLHLFDVDGHHRRSDITLMGIAPYLEGELRSRAETKLADLVDQLGDHRFEDIAIRLFRVVEDGVTFGLLDESHPERGDWAELHPDWLGFCAPWDGDYST